MYATIVREKETKGFTIVIESPKMRTHPNIQRRMRTRTEPTRKRLARVNQKKEWK
jgi:hypothetical protein